MDFLLPYSSFIELATRYGYIVRSPVYAILLPLSAFEGSLPNFCLSNEARSNSRAPRPYFPLCLTFNIPYPIVSVNCLLTSFEVLSQSDRLDHTAEGRLQQLGPCIRARVRSSLHIRLHQVTHSRTAALTSHRAARLRIAASPSQHTCISTVLR
jgi:hypothetical protein